jgi:murein DD-endopeptidase MepM/ murein hydrolase activator NlpD
VIAVAAGTVVFSGRVAGRGVVSVAHAGGLRSTYQPLEDLPARGPVRAGGPLGSLAAEASHCAPAACLHLGAVRTGTPLDAYLDPLTLLRPRPAPVLLPAPPPPSG